MNSSIFQKLLFGKWNYRYLFYALYCIIDNKDRHRISSNNITTAEVNKQGRATDNPSAPNSAMAEVPVQGDCSEMLWKFHGIKVEIIGCLVTNWKVQCDIQPKCNSEEQGSPASGSVVQSTYQSSEPFASRDLLVL